MSKLIKLRTFFDLHALYMHSWSTSNACSAERCFLAPKWLAGNRPKVSAAYETRSATTDSSIFPSVASRDIGLQAFAVVLLPLSGFLRGIIRACLHWVGRMPAASDV